MTVALDANILIYILDNDSPFSDAALSLLKRLEESKEQVYLSTVARTEILHLPYKVSASVGEQAKEMLSSFGFITFMDVSSDIADIAAELCGQIGAKLKNIDAIHLATALSVEAGEFWTNDHELTKVRVSGLDIKLLGDYKHKQY